MENINKINKVYIVHWGLASQDDDGNARAYSGVHGVYIDFSMAKQGLVNCKDEFYDELVNDPDFDEEIRKEIASTISIYGSVDEGYFEIDYILGCYPCETYISLEEKELTGSEY